MKSRMVVRTFKSPNIPKPFLAIRNVQEYDAAVEKLDRLVDEIGDRPEDPRYRLVETLSVLIDAYDREHHTLPGVNGIGILRFLMEQNGLSQSDLPEIGSQGVVSEVLSGKRSLNVRQIEALAKRFQVEPGAFL